ncbi:hypothetical protein GCM10010112_12870 [Actinoplanes lobatus]|uniref:Uncharacterized protein n=1 Tax=Actinoplanes lobatus TaxID=113568 RepID=A0A7W7HMA6_9ACTN|nr:hypothetical protein [Actinoplanes lobatus]MBB4753125.1 hypothetical protein [Actinoplanes lobatus]GGN58797.1 hypothetical protein GCM10010112_12870 [Actinoplanes lobatus]GIE43015.1 hypothetical protein Alo02nite_59130 [Actinoplanes lobatus]
MIGHPMLAVSRRWSRREGRTPFARRAFLLPWRPAGHTVVHRHVGLFLRVTRITAPVSRRSVTTTRVTASRVPPPAGRAPVGRDVLRLLRSTASSTTSHRAVLRREMLRATVSRTERTTTTTTTATTERRAHTHTRRRTEIRTATTGQVIHRHRVESHRQPAAMTSTRAIHDVPARSVPEKPAEVAVPDLDRLTDRIVDRLDQRLIAHRERFGRAF